MDCETEEGSSLQKIMINIFISIYLSPYIVIVMYFTLKKMFSRIMQKLSLSFNIYAKLSSVYLKIPLLPRAGSV